MKSIFPTLLIVLLGLPLPAAAEEVSDLYQAEVPVETQSRSERHEALGWALETVLVKVSGYGDIGIDPAVAGALDAPEQYLQQYRYREAPDAVEPDPESGGDERPLLLWVSFDAGAVKKLLRSNDLPLWSALRPDTLAWVAVEDREGRRLLAANEQSAAESALRQRAEERAVPIRLPLLDLQDQQRIAVADVWGDFRESILAASERYDADAVLVGRVFQDFGGQWQGRWALYSQQSVQQWESVGASLEQVVAQGVDGAADSLALQFARIGPELGESVVTVRVTSVGSLEDYARATRYLEGISGVQSVRPTEVAPDGVSYQMTLESSLHNVIQTINLGDVLAAERSQSAKAAMELSYRLLP